jgi:hypothetical protein
VGKDEPFLSDLTSQPTEQRLAGVGRSGGSVETSDSGRVDRLGELDSGIGDGDRLT